ncbi:DUF3331 domain-containing protein [Caballeronia sp. dw_19]|jgi:Domain of unknown function (DUF3331)|uniref:DUF3331 domain-containing protein n=1 Tax=Caballeronia sp. dw_19 TaxID=2719791 RepID=UPI001BD69080|nr:DUF3331 domain-containing protein [Caballeronia sp. dw_19]
MLKNEPCNACEEPLLETASVHTPASLQPACPPRSYTAGPGRVGHRRPAFGGALPAGTDPWVRTLSALLHFAAVPEEFREELACLQLKHLSARQPAYDPNARSFTVNVLEYLANNLVVVSWHDPTLCNYEEQVWSPALARHSGQCALSGEHISRGDSVYKPRTRGLVQPLNGDAMIRASALRKVGDG